ncbi:MAG: hypothetical protein WDZ83_14240 [Rhizobiaceae bacterium]
MTAEEECLYLVQFRLEPDAELPVLDFHGDGRVLADGLALIFSTLTQSKLYHRIKWQLPDDTPLIVATLAGPPKFRGMDSGALAWLRDRGP